MKSIRYGTPSGTLWVSYENEHVGVGSEKGTSVTDAKSVDKYNGYAASVVAKYRSEFKQPMLIVGAHAWARENAPFFLVQQFDLHFLFYPCDGAFVVGCVAFSRTKDNAEPINVFTADRDVVTAMRRLFGIVAHLGILDLRETNPKQNAWLIHWVYRCPKIALKDVLHLEAYNAETALEYETVEMRPVFGLVRGAK